jgi:hypothetical protein
MNQDKYFKILWNNVKLSARYGAGGGRVHKNDGQMRDLTISIDDLVSLWEKQDGRCYWLNIKMSLEDLEIKNSPFAPSVERLDNDFGYVSGNIVLASRFANRGRGAYQNEDFYDRLESLLQEARSEDWKNTNTKKRSFRSLSHMMANLISGRMRLAVTQG